METVFPDESGSSGALLIGWRRRPGSPPGPTSIEQVVSVIFKRSYDVTASAVDPSAGFLTPRADGPVIFEGDAPGNFLDNADFSSGLDGWSETGGAEATAGDSAVTVDRSGGAGSLQATAALGRSLRERSVGFSVKASADAGLATPVATLVAGGETGPAASFPGNFPAAGSQPILLSDYATFSAAVSAETLTTLLPTLAGDGDAVTYQEVVVATVEYESDLVPYKPHADLIVIADAPPVPLSVAVNGTVRMSQELAVPLELTGLGWEDRFDTPREGEGGDFSALSQALPDDFENSYFNGYRRDRRQGATVPYPNESDTVAVVRDGGGVYGFAMPSTRPVVEHGWYVGGEDDPCLWRHRRVVMNLDTLVIEPDRDHAYAVWRAVWPVDVDPDGTGVIALEDNRRATVVVEGA